MDSRIDKVIAVAGSSGFVGKHVVGQLTELGYKIIPIDIENGLDLSDRNIIKQLPKIDAFVHLANLVYVPASYEKPELFYRINYLTTLNALEICRKYNARMVYVSSYVYGTPQYLPIDERHPIIAFNPYAQSKVICESLCAGYNRDFNVKVSVLRPFNIYGVGQKGSLLIPEIIFQLKKHVQFVQLKAAFPRRDYINVIDVARAIVSCLEKDKSSFTTYNVCSGNSYSVKEITEIINSHLEQRVEFRFGISDRPNEVDEAKGTYDKLKVSTGWEPVISFEEGIKDIIKSEGL